MQLNHLPDAKSSCPSFCALAELLIVLRITSRADTEKSVYINLTISNFNNYNY